MLRRTRRHRRLAALVALLGLVLGTQALLAPSAGAAGFVPISGSGSTWSSNALDQWRRGGSNLYEMAVNFTADGLTNGRDEFRAGYIDFAVSEIPYGGGDGGVPDPPPAQAFGYLPIVAGGTAFMYNLKIDNRRVTNLRLSGETIAKIFTREITNWADPAIKADNPGLVLPARSIVAVVRADSSGPTAQFTSYLASQYPTIWGGYCHRGGRQLTPCGPTPGYPLSDGIQAKVGSAGVAGFVAQDSGEGAITYVEYSYARNAGFPVAKVLNAANYYVEPTATSNFGTDKGRALAEFGYYALCEGQQQAALIQCATGTGGATTPTVTTTTLEVSPSSPPAANTVETLTATISPPGVAGSVQFKDGTGSIGGPVAVSGGSASTTTTLAPGTHSLTAVFTPTDMTASRGSTSAAVSAVVSAPPGAKATATTFMVTPSGAVIQGTPVILVAQVAPANATGTIQFKDGDTELGIPRPVIGGFALTVTSKLTKGTHSLTAVFTAANQGSFGPSMAPAALLTVIGLS